MKTATFTLALLFLAFLPGQDALAHRTVVGSLDSHDYAPACVARRYDPAGARIAITTDDGSAVLLMTGRAMALQLSDRVFRELDRDLREVEDEEDCALVEAFKRAVICGVRDLLDHSLRYPLEEIRDVEYRNGRLLITTEDHERLFKRVKIDDEPILEHFSERDAQAFVREFHRLKARLD